ncbi:DUF2945 domain-containing protein [Variovorax paradoxus]|uniref:Hypervirulence associated protein TUDOR domain-containing protein n=1 Tax=Variovorax paradoxus (strain EPS) TaxID=595537 RepID=E6UWY2_VARPE|nr:DUF2945 domain-containing protein [Variovorax paradoxus]ADU36527.1 hypothetical protein Varpa_2325 [Variovorax paradoxus EPS]
MKTEPKPGDKVAWTTSQGKTTGVVTRKVTGTASVKGHTAKATKAHPEFEVKSSKSGKKAIHKAEALQRK